MRDDFVPGNPFPDLRLPEHTGEELSLSEIAKGQPLVLCFVRGWWCPKEQIRVRNLVEMQDEIQREYGKIAAWNRGQPDSPRCLGPIGTILGRTPIRDLGQSPARRRRQAVCCQAEHQELK